MRMAGVEQHAEVLVADRVAHADDLARLVEQEAGFELPDEVDAVRSGHLGRLAESVRRAPEAGLVIHPARDLGGRDDRVRAQLLGAEDLADLDVAQHVVQVVRQAGRLGGVLPRSAAIPETPVPVVIQQLLHLADLVQVSGVIQRQMRGEDAQLDAVELVLLEPLHHNGQGDRLVQRTRPDICPGAYGNLVQPWKPPCLMVCW